MATLSAIAEWPHLVKNIFLTQKKNSAGIFGIQFYIRGKPYHISLDYSIMFLDYLSKVSQFMYRQVLIKKLFGVQSLKKHGLKLLETT